MGKITVKDNSGDFIRKNENEMDRVFGMAAVDIERLAKQRVPHKTGALQTSGHFQKLAPMQYIVAFNKAYAKRWEFAREFEPNIRFGEGRQSAYLRTSAYEVLKNLKERIKIAANGLRLK